MSRVVVSVFVLSTSLFAQGRTSEKIDCGSLPEAVRAGAQKQMRQGTVASCEKIADNGSLLYLLRITINSGKIRRVTYRPDGRLTESEEEGDLSRIPAAAREAILKEIASGELRKVDVIHRSGAVLYEGEYRAGETRKKVVVDTDGRVLNR